MIQGLLCYICIMEFTDVFWWNLKSKKRGKVNQGGTSSSKTYSILQLLFLKARKHQDSGIIISVVSETFPHLKRGAMRDFFNIVNLERQYNPNAHNKTDNIYHIGKSKIEFFSVEDSSRVRGARRDILFINEANNISYESFSELEVRTRNEFFIDFNPVSEFWAHDKVINRNDVDFFKSTYLNNDFLSDEEKRIIEVRKDDPDWWRVYGQGEIGSVEGLIFPQFNLVDDFPKNRQWLCYGLDFGFTNDPTALIQVCLHNGQLYLDEIIYLRGLTNQDISDRMTKCEIDNLQEIIADSAEPKSIEEISRMGWRNIKPSEKGQDSVRSGIDTMKSYPLNITKRSTNLIKEFRNYRWAKDRQGITLNRPIDDWNHGIDAARYVAMKKCKTLGRSWIDDL